MNSIIQDAQIAHVADLLRSLKTSLWELRNTAEHLRTELENGEQSEIGSGSKELSQVKTLVSACQKTELHLAELEAERDGTTLGSAELDMEAARAEIGRRLARLRIAAGAEDVSE